MSEEDLGTPLERLRREVGELRTKLLEIDRIVGDLEVPTETGEPVSAPPPPMDLRGVSQAIRSLTQGGDQSEILQRLLEETARYSDRAALFLETDRRSYRIWRAQDFPPSSWESVQIDDGDSTLERIRRNQTLEFDLSLGEAPGWMLQLKGRGKAALYPISFGSRVPVLLYADGVPEPRFDSLELLVELARLALQNQYLSRLSQAQEQGESMLRRWPTLESIRPGTPGDIEEEETSFAESEAEAAAVEPAAETAEGEAAEGPGGLESSVASPPISEEPAEALTAETAAPSPPESPSDGEAGWEIESRADLKPEDLGLSQDEFDRLMGQASTDWLRIRRAHEETAAAAERERRESEAVAPPPEPSALESTDETGAPEDLSAVQATEPTEEKQEAEQMATQEPPSAGAEVPTSPPPLEPAADEDAAPLPEEEIRQAVSPEEPAEESPAEEPIDETPVQEPFEEASEESEPEVVPEPEATTSPEEVMQGEAHRFARLLVAEIKLYNESEVEAGRQNGDLYARLKSDIDRSREMYEKRAHPSVKASTDYFHAQLVQVLAQDQESLMGDGYPGPQVAENA